MNQDDRRAIFVSPAPSAAVVVSIQFSLMQPMPELASEQLDSLRADIAADDALVPIVKDQHGRILDGNHRASVDFWGPLFFQFFDLVRTTECDSGCPVCVSNLATEVAAK